MTEYLKNERTHFLNIFEKSINDYLKKNLFQKNNHVVAVNESMQYSLKSSGKRFRPFLAYLVFKLGAENESLLKSWALAIEFIHTYSLIHDDLPCMDNDDYRRGVPTNHKVYGEAVALLAGDSLISEAFRVISEDQDLSAEIRIQLISLLAEKIGPAGMVGGQILDMKVTSEINLEDLKKIHLLKTGYLIQAAAIGAAYILNFNEELVTKISDFSLNLGIAFQIKDDLLDFSSEAQGFKSYAHLLGFEKTTEELNRYSKLALENLNHFEPARKQFLVDLIHYNLERTQ